MVQNKWIPFFLDVFIGLYLSRSNTYNRIWLQRHLRLINTLNFSVIFSIYPYFKEIKDWKKEKNENRSKVILNEWLKKVRVEERFPDEHAVLYDVTSSCVIDMNMDDCLLSLYLPFMFSFYVRKRHNNTNIWFPYIFSMETFSWGLTQNTYSDLENMFVRFAIF